MFDTGILNTMENEIISAKALLAGTDISILDAARFVRNILDSYDPKMPVSRAHFCGKIIECGKRNLRMLEMPLKDGFALYLQMKSELRKDSFRDIKYLGARLFKRVPAMAEKNFSEISLADCQAWLSGAFSTPSQFNKGRAMLHGLFQFALRRQWCEKNAVKLVPKRKVIEREIRPLSIYETRKLLETARSPEYPGCSAAASLLVLAGIRPSEVGRLKWRDIDLCENVVTVRSRCSKTGGVRHVEIHPSLMGVLRKSRAEKDSSVCPGNWRKKWKRIRDDSGFKGIWVQDVLRHTFASYHAKHFRDLPRLQLDMGHRDQSLLRFRYVNMAGVSKAAAGEFFGGRMFAVSREF